MEQFVSNNANNDTQQQPSSSPSLNTSSPSFPSSPSFSTLASSSSKQVPNTSDSSDSSSSIQQSSLQAPAVPPAATIYRGSQQTQQQSPSFSSLPPTINISKASSTLNPSAVALQPPLSPFKKQTFKHSPSNSIDSLGNSQSPSENSNMMTQHKIPSSSSYSSLNEINAPIPQPPMALHQKSYSMSNSRSSSPAIKGSHPMYSNIHNADSTPSLVPPSPSFNLNNSASVGQSIVRSSSTPNVLQQANGATSPYPSSPMLHPQRNSSGTSLLPPHPRHSSRGPSRPFSTMSSASSIDLGSGSHHHATDFYSYTSKDKQHGRTQSMVFGDLPGTSYDFTQSTLSSSLGANSTSLVPRMKTIEMYRKNAKKSNDPVIQFQFAQYMLQTALLASTAPVNINANGKSPNMNPQEDDFELEFPNLPNSSLGQRQVSNGSSISLGNSPSRPTSAAGAGTHGPYTAQDERKIKRDLLKEAISLLRRLSDKGYADAQYLLGDAYSSGAIGKPDAKEAFSLFQLAAKHGHAEASYRAALCLEEGWGVSKDARKALQFLRQAASRNHPGAMLRLGIACFYGKLGLHLGASSAAKVKIQQEGIKWLTRAADAANEIFPQGPYELAKIYEVGYRDLIFKDLQYAVQLYVRSADLNYVPAATKLGRAYEYGELGCPQDAALSIHYYTIGALGGDPNAMLAMCAWYMVGAEPMLPRNEEEAYEWAIRAAQKGLPKAQYATGYFMENGIGTERDILQASAWYHKAAAAGDERAAERIRTNRLLARQKPLKHRRKVMKDGQEVPQASNNDVMSSSSSSSNNAPNSSAASVRSKQSSSLQPPQGRYSNLDRNSVYSEQQQQQQHSQLEQEEEDDGLTHQQHEQLSNGSSSLQESQQLQTANNTKKKEKDCIIM